MSFQNFNLDSSLMRALEACNFTEPTEVQRRSIPVVMAGRDLMASAQTGTGKTAAFVLPALQRLLQPPKGNGHGPRVLILTPTRELATQINDVIRELGRFSTVRYGSIVGGVAYPPQQRLLRNNLDILVATPGRLIDHMDSRRVDFSRLEMLVLDEADRMLDMGFVQAVERIASETPKARQTLLFSATLEGNILEVAKRHLKNPERVQLAAAKRRHEAIDQWMHMADDLRHKKAVLDHLLDDPDMSQAVIFTATKRRAKKLAEDLSSEGHACTSLHGNMTQAARQRTVDQMRRGRVRVLVATDVAARGLDVPGITHVINFELPMTPEDYIHRIGRTGRAGASGTAISLVGHMERSKLGQIERLTGSAVERRQIPGLEATHRPPSRRPGGQHPNNGYRGGGRSRGYQGNGGRRSNNSGGGSRRWRG
ncbi:MAG: DEAD/DEAH box helicase [Leptospirillia bacterium]